MKVVCPYCDRQAEWVDNSVVYGKRYGKSYMMWWCRECGASVGCHNNTKRPLGTMANKELKKKRSLVHRVMDPLWIDGYITRGRLYKLLKEHFGKEVHIGESDLKTCGEILRFSYKLKDKYKNK